MGDNAELLKKLKQEQAGKKGKKSQKKDGKKSKLSEMGEPDKNKSKSKKRKETPCLMQGKLQPGFVLKSKNGTIYNVEAQIKDSVYVTRNKSNNRLYALKVEYPGCETETKQLKRDVFVLLDAAKHQKRFNRHFPKLHTKGRIPNTFNYLMMALCDYNLDDLRTTVLEGCDFSKANAARLCMQAFQAVHDLHSLGYVHRAISPSKFVLGIERPHLIYMIGFSMAYHFEQRYETKVSTSPRRLAPKLAKRMFLPRSYHRNKDFHRKDDLEAWIYLCFNLFGRKILPWNEQFNDLNMLVNKERLFGDEFEECYKYVPLQFKTIMHALDKLDDTARPDYTFIGMMLVTMKENIKFDFYGPFEWQKGGDNEYKKNDDEDQGEELKLGDGAQKGGDKGPKKKKGEDDDDSGDEQEGGGGGANEEAF